MKRVFNILLVIIFIAPFFSPLSQASASAEKAHCKTHASAYCKDKEASKARVCHMEKDGQISQASASAEKAHCKTHASGHCKDKEASKARVCHMKKEGQTAKSRCTLSGTHNRNCAKECRCAIRSGDADPADIHDSWLEERPFLTSSAFFEPDLSTGKTLRTSDRLYEDPFPDGLLRPPSHLKV